MIGCSLKAQFSRLRQVSDNQNSLRASLKFYDAINKKEGQGHQIHLEIN
jgi:hypothetical protein